MMDLNSLVRTNIQNLKPYSSARDEFSKAQSAMVFLDANENPFNNGLNRYPDPQQNALKVKIAQWKKVETANILLGNGSDEVLDLLFRAFCEPNQDNVITLPPTYGMYKVLAAINAVEEREVLLNTEFQPDVDAVLKAGDNNSKIIFICSPNNPTGNAFLSEKIEQILINFKGLVVIDEAYADFSTCQSWLVRLNEFPNLIVTQTFSKAFGMAGIRLGMCFASKEITAVLNTIKPPYNINQLTQNEAVVKLDLINEVESQIVQIKGQRTILETQLKSLNFVEKIYPSDANFILVKVDDAAKRYKQLIERGIVLRNRSGQPLCNNTLRITVGTAEENKTLIMNLKNLNND
jgi:histidinol-phosphate aminotransferase